jgi:hypothetical protein
MRIFEDDDAGYLAWIDGHQHGFVVNTTRKPDPRRDGETARRREESEVGGRRSGRRREGEAARRRDGQTASSLRACCKTFPNAADQLGQVVSDEHLQDRDPVAPLTHNARLRHVARTTPLTQTGDPR